MNFTELFESLKNKDLRYISMGWTRIYPFRYAYVTHSKQTNAFPEQAAEMILECGAQLTEQMLISCHKNRIEYDDYN